MTPKNLNFVLADCEVTILPSNFVSYDVPWIHRAPVVALGAKIAKAEYKTAFHVTIEGAIAPLFLSHNSIAKNFPTRSGCLLLSRRGFCVVVVGIRTGVTMAAESKLTANERLVRKRLAARLRQRRCRERKREAAALRMKKLEFECFGSVTSTSSQQPAVGGPGLDRPVLSNGRAVVPNSASLVSPIPATIVSSPSTTRYEPTLPKESLIAGKPPSSSKAASPVLRDFGPVPVSPGNSTAEEPAVGAVEPANKKPLASQEMAAIDAMLALRSNDGSTTGGEDGEEETASTSSLSTKEDHRPSTLSSRVSVSLVVDRPKVPETVYHPYRPSSSATTVGAPPPASGHAYYHPPHHYQHLHQHQPSQPWENHYYTHYPHPVAYLPLFPPAPHHQPSYYWTRPGSVSKPSTAASSAVSMASRVRI